MTKAVVVFFILRQGNDGVWSGAIFSDIVQLRALVISQTLFLPAQE